MSYGQRETHESLASDYNRENQIISASDNKSETHDFCASEAKN